MIKIKKNNNTKDISMNAIHYNNDDKINQISDDEDFSFDLDLDEKEVLKRYYTIYSLIKKHKVLQIKPAYDLSNLQGSIIDYSVCFALLGPKYLDMFQMNLQYTVLQAALILTITIPLFVNPPVFEGENAHWFSFFVGFSANLHLYTIIGITIMSALFNRPYTEADRVLIRIENNTLMVITTICNYIAVVSCIVAVLIAGFDRSWFDGGIQSYIVILVLVLIYNFIKSSKQGDFYQDNRCLLFYKKYCLHDGLLKQEYLSLVKQQ